MTAVIGWYPHAIGPSHKYSDIRLFCDSCCYYEWSNCFDSSRLTLEEEAAVVAACYLGRSVLTYTLTWQAAFFPFVFLCIETVPHFRSWVGVLYWACVCKEKSGPYFEDCILRQANERTAQYTKKTKRKEKRKKWFCLLLESTHHQMI